MSVLKKGSKGPEVVQLQRDLIALKYLAAGQDDGDFGGITDAAVRKFQMDNQLFVDGVVGDDTRKQLAKLLGASSPPLDPIEATKKLIKDNEGAGKNGLLNVYLDTEKNPTIGWGHKLPKNTTITTITQNEADAFFEADFATARSQAMKFVDNFASLEPARQAVLIDMAFNLGYNPAAPTKKGLAGFVQLKKAVESRDWVAAVKEMGGLWETQVKRRAKRDQAIMLSGVF